MYTEMDSLTNSIETELHIVIYVFHVEQYRQSHNVSVIFSYANCFMEQKEVMEKAVLEGYSLGDFCVKA